MIISFSIEVSRGAKSEKHLNKLKEQQARAIDLALEQGEYMGKLSAAMPLNDTVAAGSPDFAEPHAELKTNGYIQPRPSMVHFDEAGTLEQSAQVEPVANEPTRIQIPVKTDEEAEKSQRRSEAGKKAAETRKINELKKAEAVKREQRRAKRAATIAAKKKGLPLDEQLV